ncbi:MAG: iron complex transport system ATP-binding protein [Betaproteobacteria bacterium]|jgi:iron complex transport system ATP-binding protein|nr:iron complex transport system ATP-binding protein [Betaproteobacteria bacterium]
MDTSAPVLEAQRLDVTIGGLAVCRGLDLAVRPGEAWAILGTNGVGKTTLLHTLAGLRASAAGEVHLRGRPLRALRRKEAAREIGLMLQDCDSAFPVSVREAVLEGRHPFLHRFHWESAEDEAAAIRALEELGIGHLAARDLQTLSGGEKRLVAAATLFVQDPPILMLDEPNSHLDLYRQLHVLQRVSQRVRERSRAALLVVHDVNLALRFCSHALLLQGDANLACGPIAAVLDERSIERAFRHPVIRLAGPAGPHFVPT